MKKTVGLLLVMFLLTFTVFAAYYDVGVSLTYDSFSFVEKVKEEDGTTESKIPHDALGVNIAGTYWFTNTLGVEAGLDFAKGDIINMSSDTFSMKSSSQLIGPSVAVKYLVLKSPVFVNVKAGAGYYFYNMKTKTKTQSGSTTVESTPKLKEMVLECLLEQKCCIH